MRGIILLKKLFFKKIAFGKVNLEKVGFRENGLGGLDSVVYGARIWKSEYGRNF